MPVLSKVGNFNIGTGAAASTVAVTGVGFTPKVILLWWSGLTASSNGDRATHIRGFGVTCGPSDFRCVGTRDWDARPSAESFRGHREDACIVEVGTAAFDGWADLQSFNADGFTLEILDQFATDLYVTYLALGGSSITAAESGRFTAAGTAPVNQTVNNVGNFQPSVTFFFGISAFDPNAWATDEGFFLGVATGSGDEQVWTGGSNTGEATPNTATYCRSGEAIAISPSSPHLAPADRAEFVSHNASPGGFTVNWLERSNGLRVFWLSIAGGDWSAGNLLTRTDTNAITVSGLASRPSAMLFVSGNRAETAQDAVPDAHDEWSMGAATSPTARAVQHVASRDGAADSYVFRAARSDAVYVNADPVNTSFTLEGLMDVQSVENDGFTCVMDDVDPAQAFVWYVAVGPASPPRMALLGVG
jgi:hypothetical protein